jgi:phage tail sheath gpL-like
MAITFNSVPSGLLTPFMSVEFDNSRANQGPAILQYRALIIGQKTSSGTATANQLYLVTSADQVATLAGRGSMLHRQAKGWFAGNKATPVYIGVLADNGAGTAATGTVTIAGPATAAGTLAMYLGGEVVNTAVASGDSAATIATALAAAVNANTDLPVTAAAVSAVVTLTYRHKGLAGNEYDVRANYQGESFPAGVSATVVALASGATNPTLTTLISNMGDSWFHVVAHPYTDATSLTALETEFEDRWGPIRQIDGRLITAKSDTYANVATLGNGRNSKQSTIIRTNDSPTPPAEYAAHVAAVAALSLQKDPAQPLQTLQLPYIKPPAEIDQDTLLERNVLLTDGISTTKVVGGVVAIERLVTTYKTNSAGSADPSYRDVTTMATLLYVRFSFRARITDRYPRHKLTNDGTKIGAGQAVITPSIGKAEALLWFRDLETAGLVENFDQFKADLVCERDASDPNRLNWLLPPDLVNGFIVGAVKTQFRL